MGLKDNFRQAAKELMEGPEATRPRGYAEPRAEPPLEPSKPFIPGPVAAPELTTIIAPGTVIRGSVESNSNMELYGEIQGDIVTTKDLKLRGKIQGNATGCNVELYNIHMLGNLTASENATMDSESEIEGDVTADSLTLNGKVWGDIRVSQRLVLESSAVVCGRVAAERLSVDDGAIIQGEVLIGQSVLPPKQPSAQGEAPRPEGKAAGKKED